MHKSNYKDTFVTDLIDNSKREFVGDAPPGSMGDLWPGFWKSGNPFQRVGDFGCKLISKSKALGVVIVNSFNEFLFCASKDIDNHFVLSLARTVLNGLAVISPASKPSRRDSASSAHI